MNSSSKLELGELVKKLKYEKLFIANERREIESLNKKVQHLCTNLLQQSWLTGQHRLALENLSRGQLQSPFTNEYVANFDGLSNGEGTELDLVEAQKVISPRFYQSYVDFLVLLRTHPDIVGLCITTYERERHHLIPITTDSGGPSGVSSGQVLQAIINVYGGVGGPLPGDGTLHLKLLSVLAGMQVVGSENPRRVLRQGSTAFSSLYRLMTETIPSARLFLVGSLHQPVTQLLSSPELLALGTTISPNTPLSMEVSLSTFGPPANKDIALLDRTEKMARLTQLFLESILDNIHAFPSGLAWLIQSIQRQLSESLPEKEVRIICTDLVWALFICPAVTNPEPFGVTDAPVGTQERHILSQVATILQALALSSYEQHSQHLTEYISYFDTSLSSSVLDAILTIENASVEDPVLSALFRRTIYLPENQLAPLFSWLKETLLLLERNGKLTDIEIWPVLVKLSSAVTESLPPSPSHQLQTPVATRTSTSPNSSNTPSPSHRPSNFLSNGRTPSLLQRKDGRGSGMGDEDVTENNTPTKVLVFPITNEGWEWVGMLPESEVRNARKSEKGSNEGDSLVGLDEADGEEERSLIGEKRTRFSISQDDASIGTSDNLEAVSEAASTHSVSSSIELEDQNDNLSDMMSANVSGRGTPNVSGRNTPLSQAEEEDEEEEAEERIVEAENLENAVRGGEDEAMEEEGAAALPLNNPNNINPPNIRNLNLNGRPNPSKQARSDIDDKFCKFEIKKLFGGDETVSLVSDTWSTDVLASDSEMGGEGRLLLPLPPDQQNQSSRVSVDASGGGESMSEAWSTDVAASDIERLHDFDTEDTGSVARSDETGRFELEGPPDDTPRSSVSGGGGGSYPPQQPIDLLLFGDIQQLPNNEDSASGLAIAPADSTSGNDLPMEVEGGGGVAEVKDIPSFSLPSSSGVSTSRVSSLIPKTITFDKTAERGDRYDEEPGRTRKFFKNLKIFRGRVGRKTRSGEDRFDWSDRMPENPSLSVPKMRKSFSDDVPIPPVPSSHGLSETSDDILAKYRRKPSLTDSPFSLPVFSTSRDVKTSTGSSPILTRKESIKINRSDLASEARKKLRSVLGNCDLQLVHDGSSVNGVPLDIALVNILRVEVASAISRADNVNAAQLQEAIRTIQKLGIEGCKKVIRQLRDDYRRRSDYVAYLIRAKQGLLSTLNFLERGVERSRHEGETYTHYLVTEWIRLRLEEPGQDSLLDEFISNFRGRKTVDEKMEGLESFLSSRLAFFVANRKELTQNQMKILEKALEQHLVTRVYYYALHPNGEVDIHRDAVLKEHITKLGNVVTPAHKDLRIPKAHLSECPWPPAQRELRMLSAYRTASDKLRCVLRASSLILNLLATSAEKAMAADDFVPVLVYVMIKSNPPALLSTIQYVNSFYAGKMGGEEEYWWTQFCSAVEFIKTMDYNE